MINLKFETYSGFIYFFFIFFFWGGGGGGACSIVINLSGGSRGDKLN